MDRVLIIDDDPNSTIHVELELKERNSEIQILKRDFSNGIETASRFLPHIVILDLIEGDPVDGQDLGIGFYDKLWNKKCCPTIIHSARADDLGDQFEDNAFVKVITKGSGAELKVADAIDEFQKTTSALRSVEERMHVALSRFLTRAMTKFTEMAASHGEGSPAIVEYCALRHIAALLDEPDGDGRNLNPWECYLFPPIGHSLQLGDIILKVGESEEVASSYSIVLTPSCDLVRVGDRDPKVSKALTCRCKPVAEYFKALRVKKDRLPEFLSQGYHKHLLPLPEFPGEWPALAGDFRDLGLVSLEDVALAQASKESEPYVRVGSLDSPFRELVSWAFVQHSGRPGLPDRDFATWASAIIEESNRG